MRKFIRIFALAAFSTVILNSCAKQEEKNFDDVVAQSFDYWMLQNNPQAEKTDYGVYIEKIVESPSGDKPKAEDWVNINYTGYLINDAVYATRNKEVAQRIGTFRYTTNFVPQFTYMSESIMPKGQYDALLNDMKTGDTYRLFIPPASAYPDGKAFFNNGYSGTSAVYAKAPIILDLELVDVVEDPEEYESELVAEYALEKWGQTEADTVKKDFYINYISSVEGSKIITEDSTVFLNYTGRFLNDFVFDTNIIGDAIESNIFTDTTDYAALEYVPSEATLIQAFYDAILREGDTMKYNDKFSMVFSSVYGYGTAGKADGATTIQAYNPLVFDVTILPYMGYAENPYDANYIINSLSETDADPKDGVYVYGYVVGCVAGDVISNSTVQMESYEDKFTDKTNLLIANTADEDDVKNCIAIDLSSNPEIQEKYNLVDNPTKYGIRLVVKGSLKEFKGRTGVTDLE